MSVDSDSGEDAGVRARGLCRCRRRPLRARKGPGNRPAPEVGAWPGPPRARSPGPSVGAGGLASTLAGPAGPVGTPLAGDRHGGR